MHAAQNAEKVSELKNKCGYVGDKEDIKFDTSSKVINIAFVCMVASLLCGCTGIAGGMVLGPLFMSYGMKPKVMAATNQYITMISSVSVVI